MAAHVADQRPLSDAECRSLAPAYANVIKSLGGRTRILGEKVVGASMLTGEVAAAPTNPQGRGCGVDFSGPPFGSAWRTPMWWIGGIKEDVSGDWEGQSRVGPATSTAPLTIAIRFWNRPHARFDKAPHSRCYLNLRAYKTTGTSATATAKYGYSAGGPLRSQDFSVTSTSEATFDLIDAYWDVVPGRNEILLTVTTDHDVMITGALGHQRVKRSH